MQGKINARVCFILCLLSTFLMVGVVGVMGVAARGVVVVLVLVWAQQLGGVAAAPGEGVLVGQGSWWWWWW